MCWEERVGAVAGRGKEVGKSKKDLEGVGRVDGRKVGLEPRGSKEEIGGRSLEERSTGCSHETCEGGRILVVEDLSGWEGRRPKTKPMDEEGSKGSNCREPRKRDGDVGCRSVAVVVVGVSAVPVASPLLSRHDGEQQTATCPKDLPIRRRGRLQDEAERRKREREPKDFGN